MKKFVLFLTMGTLLGAVLAAWFSPQIITWWFAPPVEIAINCKGAVEWGIETYRKSMFIGAIAGSFLGIMLALLVSKNKKHPEQPRPNPSTGKPL